MNEGLSEKKGGVTEVGVGEGGVCFDSLLLLMHTQQGHRGTPAPRVKFDMCQD